MNIWRGPLAGGAAQAAKVAKAMRAPLTHAALVHFRAGGSRGMSAGTSLVAARPIQQESR